MTLKEFWIRRAVNLAILLLAGIGCVVRSMAGWCAIGILLLLSIQFTIEDAFKLSRELDRERNKEGL